MKEMDIKAIRTYVDNFYPSSRIPGLQVCVYDGAEAVFCQSYGIKNCQSEALLSSTVMGIASITKTITALAFSLLCSQGKASINDAVIQYFPSLKIPGTPAESLLVGHLLNHTSGIPALALHSWCVLDHTEPDEWEKEVFEAIKSTLIWKSGTAEDIVRYISQSGDYKSIGQPGMFFNYLNEGYALLTAIIEQVSGMPYETFVQQEIFEPLEMFRSSFSVKGTRDVTSLFLGTEGPASDAWYCAPPYLGTGYARSTADEIARLFGVLSTNGQYKGKQVFPKCAVERLAGYAFALSEQGVYCYGIHKRSRNGSVLLRHNGALKGVSSAAGFVATTGRSYAILANLEGARIDELENALQNLITDAPLDTPPYTPQPLLGKMPLCPHAYAGMYYIMEDMGYTIEVTPGNGVLTCVFGSAVGGCLGEAVFLYCGKTEFVEQTDRAQKRILEFHFEDDLAIGVQYGGRFYQRRK